MQEKSNLGLGGKHSFQERQRFLIGIYNGQTKNDFSSLNSVYPEGTTYTADSRYRDQSLIAGKSRVTLSSISFQLCTSEFLLVVYATEVQGYNSHSCCWGLRAVQWKEQIVKNVVL